MDVPEQYVITKADRTAVESGCYWDETRALTCIDFLESFCVQSKAPNYGKTIKVLPWQRDYLLRLYSWKLPDGRQRHRQAIIFSARKIGKTSLLAGQASSSYPTGWHPIAFARRHSLKKPLDTPVTTVILL